MRKKVISEINQLVNLLKQPAEEEPTIATFKESEDKKYSLDLPKVIRCFYIYDLGDDGDLKIIVGSDDRNYIHIYENKQDQRIPLKSFNLKELRLYSIHSADIDNDGLKEIVFGFDKGLLLCLKHTKEMQFDEVFQFSLESNRKINHVYATDVDNDGKVEILLGSDDKFLYIIDNEGNKKKEINTENKVRSFYVSDVDGDGEKEILLGANNEKLHILNSKGDIKKIFHIGDTIFSIYAEDIDKDGVNEILIGTGNKLKTLIILNGITGEKKWQYEFNSPIWNLYASDLTNDGEIDLIVSSEIHGSKEPSLFVLDSRGNLKWTYISLQSTEDKLNPIQGLYTFDYNDDGDKEIVISFTDKIKFIKLYEESQFHKLIKEKWTSLIRKFEHDEGNPIGVLLKDYPTFTSSGLVFYLPLFFSDEEVINFVSDEKTDYNKPYNLISKSHLINRLNGLLPKHRDVFFSAIIKFIGDGDKWVKQTVTRRLSELAASYPDEVLAILLHTMHDPENWIRHESARVIADLCDAHPNRMVEILNALIEHNCPVELYDYLSYLPQNKTAQKIFTVTLKLMSESSHNEMKTVLEEAVVLFSDMDDTPGAKAACQTYQYLLHFYRANSVEEIVK